MIKVDLFCEVAVSLSMKVKQMCIILEKQVPLPFHFCHVHREITV